MAIYILFVILSLFLAVGYTSARYKARTAVYARKGGRQRQTKTRHGDVCVTPTLQGYVVYWSLALLAVLVIGGAVSSLATTIVATSHYVDLASASQEYELLRERRDYLIAEVAGQLDHLEDYEREVLREVNTARFLLRFPDIKANDTAWKQTQLILALNQDLVAFQNTQVETWRTLVKMERNPLVMPQMPWYPQVEDYFQDGINPLVTNVDTYGEFPTLEGSEN